MSKAARTFRCPQCNSKCTTLSTMFIGWPIDDFKRLSEEQKTQFWQSTGTGKADLKQAVEEQVILRRIKSKWNENKGDFQPLSWYTHNGYDVSKFSSDLEKEWNADMGCMTFRVKVHGSGQRLQEDLARTEITTLLRRQPGERAPKKPRTGAEPPEAPGEAVVTTEAPAEAPGGEPVTEDVDDEPLATQTTTTSSSTSSSSTEKRHKLRKGKKKTAERHGCKVPAITF